MYIEDLLFADSFGTNGRIYTAAEKLTAEN